MENSTQKHVEGKQGEVFTFKVERGRDLGACCNQDSARFSLTYPVIFPGKLGGIPHVVATNGKIACVVPVDGRAPSEPLQLPPKAVKASGKDMQVTVNGEVRCETQGKTAVHRLPDGGGLFPDLGRVFERALINENGFLLLRLDAQLLLNLAKSISASSCLSLLVPIPKTGTDLVTGAIPVLGSNQTADGDTQYCGAGLISTLLEETFRYATSERYIEMIRSFAAELPGQISFVDAVERERIAKAEVEKSVDETETK